MDRPKVITLCGSSRFKDAHEKAQADLTLQGCIVIPMGMYGHLAGIDMDGEVKKMLDKLHFRKIEISDSIFVVNKHAMICSKCKRHCDFTWQANEKYVWNCSVCCNEEATLESYIGESTRNEIEYAKSLGKEIMYLNPIE